MNIGDRFTKRDARTYTERGERREHRLTLLCEVESVDAVGFSWRAVEALDESDAPTTFAPSRPTHGTTAWFGWDAALARGDVQKI